MSLSDLWPFLLTAICAAIIFAVGTAERNRTVGDSFRKLKFRTPSGEVGSDAVRVVKEVLNSPMAGDGVIGAYRYCVGPGSSYFLAICQTVGQTRRQQPIVEWVVRPLSAERMRHALAGDEDALRAAFGDVVHDRLHA